LSAENHENISSLKAGSAAGTVKVMAPIKRPLSIENTSPVTKILSCLHCATHDEPAAFVLHLIFHFFYEYEVTASHQAPIRIKTVRI
jgi:hypothetical protein